MLLDFFAPLGELVPIEQIKHIYPLEVPLIVVFENCTVAVIRLKPLSVTLQKSKVVSYVASLKLVVGSIPHGLSSYVGVFLNSLL